MPPEIMRLIAAYRSCDPDDAEAMLYALMRERGPTVMLPWLFDLRDEARQWADTATIPELDAYGYAATDALGDTPSGRKLRVHRAVRALQALEPSDLRMLRARLGEVGWFEAAAPQPAGCAPAEEEAAVAERPR